MDKNTVNTDMPEMKQKKVTEFTVTSIIMGILLAVVFGAANAYLGLRVGMTISASIPAAVISMGIMRMILKRNSILENNMVQTIGSAGESLAAGAIFTVPVLFMWASEGMGEKPGFVELALICLFGGVLGVLFMVPLRLALVVNEHEKLPYPEGTACARVLAAGEKKGDKSATVFAGLGIGALYKFIADGLKLFPSQVKYDFKGYRGAGIGADVLPALLGVGYICGARVASYMLSGGITAWLVIMPLIAFVGGENTVYPGLAPISEMNTGDLWSSYIRYVGAGAVAAGGILSLIKAMPLITDTIRKTIGKFGMKGENTERTNRDMPMGIVLGGIAACGILMWLIPVIPLNLPGAIIIIVFGFFFATVSSRMVGLVGSSNNPVSGMAIATLILSTLLLKVTGNTGAAGMTMAIAIGTVVCIVAAMSGDTSQDLKTGFLLGATPVKQQIGEILGVAVSALTIGGVLYILDTAWGFGSEEIAAPQATLMKLVVEGVMDGNLPWNLVFVGVGIAVVVEILHVPVLPFAVGLYLPIYLSTPIVIGGLVRLYLSRKKMDEQERHEKIENGMLYASGLIAGEGLVGVLLAVMTIVTVYGVSLSEIIDISDMVYLDEWGGIAAFGLLLLTMLYYINRKKKCI